MTAVGVVVPAYHPRVETLSAFVRALDDVVDPATIRIELDDPRDGVVDHLEALPATVNAVRERRGKGGAITSGFEALDTDVLAFADADGSTPAHSIADVLTPLRSGRADLSVGSRRHPEADVRSHQTLARRHMGDAFAWLARRMLDAELYDYQCGAKAMTRATWESVREHLYSPGFAWDVELVAMAGALDHTIVEVPVTWEDDPASTVSPIPTTIDLGATLVRARHRAKRLRGNPLHRVLSPGRDGVPLVDRLAPDAEER